MSYRIQGECNLEDAELVRLKSTFSEGLEYLRNFQVRNASLLSIAVLKIKKNISL